MRLSPYSVIIVPSSLPTQPTSSPDSATSPKKNTESLNHDFTQIETAEELFLGDESNDLPQADEWPPAVSALELYDSLLSQAPALANRVLLDDRLHTPNVERVTLIQTLNAPVVVWLSRDPVQQGHLFMTINHPEKKKIKVKLEHASQVIVDILASFGEI